MPDTMREIIAYALIALSALVVIPWAGISIMRRKREKLRRQGIKRYGH